MGDLNHQSNTSYPAWLPTGFEVTTTRDSCPSTTHTLVSFAIYNCISIACFALLGHSYVSALLSRGKKGDRQLPPWSLWGALAQVAVQLLGNVATSLLIRAGGYDASIWQLMQLWALRPRVAWLLGNVARFKRDWGYANGALNKIFVEVFVCGLATVFLGRTVHAAWSHSEYSTVVWRRVILWASMIMLVSTGMEIVWALWMLKRVLENWGRAEASDVDSMKWIAAFFVPVTALCSWLVWVAFLKSADGFYCAKNSTLVGVVWGVVPVVENIARQLIEMLRA